MQTTCTLTTEIFYVIAGDTSDGILGEMQVEAVDSKNDTEEIIVSEIEAPCKSDDVTRTEKPSRFR